MWSGMAVLLIGIICCFLFYILRHNGLHRYGWRKLKVQDSSTPFPRQPPKAKWVRKVVGQGKKMTGF